MRSFQATKSCQLTHVQSKNKYFWAILVRKWTKIYQNQLILRKNRSQKKLNSIKLNLIKWVWKECSILSIFDFYLDEDLGRILSRARGRHCPHSIDNVRVGDISSTWHCSFQWHTLLGKIFGSNTAILKVEIMIFVSINFSLNAIILDSIDE